VLNKRLRALARDGLIRKQPDGKRHVHVLTDLGQEIVAVLSRIADLQDAAEPPDQIDEPPAAPGRSNP
jgi:DNA-binding HxlR family transcriptional regulator